MLETSRLRLVPLDYELLQLYLYDFAAFCKALGTADIGRQNDPLVAAEIPPAFESFIAAAQKDPENEWICGWEIILSEENVAIGEIGFGGKPDEKGEVTVGYGLDIRFHRKGYAAEALATVVRWGFRSPSLKAIVADTPVWHRPSHQVLLKNSFSIRSRDSEIVRWERLR